MIAVDTSALLAIALDQPQAARCTSVLEAADEVLISAGTVSEALIVARRRSVGPDVERLIREARMQVVPVTLAEAMRVADAYDRWGRGVHPAGLNWGDCFAYALACARRCPLLFIGNDFTKTDIAAAIVDEGNP